MVIVTTPDRYPIPNRKQKFRRQQIFYYNRLKCGIHQIPLSETDMEKTAFFVNNGKYQFTTLAFGLKNASVNFPKNIGRWIATCATSTSTI